jgi:hypothetical protein
MLPPLVVIHNIPIAIATVNLISDGASDLSSETSELLITFGRAVVRLKRWRVSTIGPPLTFTCGPRDAQRLALCR